MHFSSSRRHHHNLPMRRIKELLNSFEHNVTVQTIVDRTAKNLFSMSSTIHTQDTIDNVTDSILTSKKSYEVIDDEHLLNDVRLCINDMILFLTSNFYQTRQSSTSLSLPSSDLSVMHSSSSTNTTVMSLPSTPSTAHTLFHRSLSRFSSTTTSTQEKPFNNEHLRRLPTIGLARCIDNVTSSSTVTTPMTTNENILVKKRRKNKSKQSSSNEPRSNTNNNNNTRLPTTKHANNGSTQPSLFHVILAEDCSEMIVIDEFDNMKSTYDLHW
jgi:hypothetical protein